VDLVPLHVQTKIPVIFWGGCEANHKSIGTKCGDSASGCFLNDECNGFGTCEDVVNLGGSCEDGNSCTSGDSCNLLGQCISGSPDVGESCNDGNSCTSSDKCDIFGGCAGTADVYIYYCMFKSRYL